MSFRHWGRIFASLFAVASLSHAGIIYSTDGTAAPGFINSPNAYASYASESSTAARFVAVSSGLLDDIAVAVSSNGGGTFQENLELRQDNGGLPGNVIDTIAITIPNSPALITGVSTSHPSLISGQAYWLELTMPPTALVGWYLSSPELSGTVLGSLGNDGPWQPACPSCDGASPAFALISQDASVPEPGTMKLMLGSMLALIALRKTILVPRKIYAEAESPSSLRT